MKTFIKNNNYDAIVFDLDGTLYHKSYYVSLYYDFTKNTLEKLLSISPEDIDLLLKSHNISRDYREEQGSVTDLITQLGISLDTWNKHRRN